jgi:signal transduction histidine kinase
MSLYPGIPENTAMPRRILIVEDSATQAASLEAILQAQGFEVNTAPDGRAGLSAIRTFRPDLVVSDVVMPELSGFEMCKAIKADEELKFTPVILLTSLTDPMDIIAGLECGADNFITKPFEAEHLVRRVANLLASRDLRRDGRSQMSLQLSFMNNRYIITSEREQILDLLISTFEQAVRLNQQLQNRHDELERVNRQLDIASAHKSRFLASMSHDLRTPLNAILGFAQLLLLDNQSPEHRDHAEQILRAGRHLLDLINEVLDIARIESGHLSLSPEPVGVREIVADALDLIRPLAEQRGITLSIEPEQCIERHVRADRQRLQQVLLNLLSNAVKYNRHGGAVTVSCEDTSEGRLRISISDTGAGISPQKSQLLFTAFERLGAEQMGIEGTGLGLALAKGLVEAMGGRIGMHSEVDRGSTFWVELAVAESPHGAATEPLASPPADAAATAGTVLCIEDNPSNIRLIQRVLARRPGVDFLSATQGSRGMALARERCPSLILLDLNLPDMSGEEVLRLLWEDVTTRSIPVAILSADAAPTQMKRMLAAGALAYLAKPIDVPQLLRLIDDVLNPARQ